MIYGAIDGSGVPFITVEVAGREWKVVIDTGFNGYQELPFDLAPHVNPRFYNRAPSLLAANQSIEEDNYFVDFPFDGDIVRAVATFSDGSGILLGTQMIRDYKLTVDFVTGEVILERLI